MWLTRWCSLLRDSEHESQAVICFFERLRAVITTSNFTRGAVGEPNGDSAKILEKVARQTASVVELREIGASCEKSLSLAAS